MLSVREWLFGPTNKPKKAEAIKPEITKAARWVSTGNGSYTKVLEQLPSAESQTAEMNVSSLLNNDEKTHDSTNDAIANYQSQLDKAIEAEQERLTKWKKAKEKIIGTDTTLNSYPSNRNINVHHGMKSAIVSFFKMLFEGIKENILPAQMELHQLIEKTHREIEVLYKHLEDSCQTVREKESETEQRMMAVDMCDTSIDIINDNMQLLYDIKKEISDCLKDEIIVQAIASAIAELALFIIFKVALPVNLDFSGSYRYFLNSEISEEKKEIDRFETDVNGSLDRATNIIKLLEKGWEEKNSNKPAPLPLLTGGVDKLLLLAAPKQNIQTNHQDQPSLSPAPT